MQKQVELIFGDVKTVISLDQVSTEKGMGNGASGVGERFLDQGAGYIDILTLRYFIKLYSYDLYPFCIYIILQ